MKAKVPRYLVMNGQGLNYAGDGRSPGAHAFVNPATGEVVDVYFGKVVSTGSAFAMCAVANNPAMPAVRVDHSLLNGTGPLKLGQIVMIAISFDARGPRAQGAWPVEAKKATKPSSVRKLGTITAVKPGYGFIRPGDGTPDVFFHVSAVANFTPAVGLNVSFTAVTDARGPKAVDVHRA